MNFSTRAKSELNQIFTKLDDARFDEDTIEKLLRYIRSYCKNQNLIWEFASFIAHPEERNQGILHNALDVNYSKLKYSNFIGKSLKINPLKIEKYLFETLILGSLKDYSEKDLINKVNLTKKECNRILSNTYKKKGNFYILTKYENLQLFQKITSVIISTIKFKDAIKINSLIEQFRYCLKKIATKLDMTFNTNKFLKENKNELILCIMSLTHSALFNLYDGEKGICKLSVLPNMEAIIKDKIELTILLEATIKVNNSIFKWPLMTLKENINKFIPNSSIIISNSGIRLLYFNAIRNNKGQLIIGEKKI